MTIPKTLFKDNKWGESHGKYTAIPNFAGDLAIKLAGNMAMVMGDVDGEDKAGRQKLKLMDPLAVAQRACDIAQKLTEVMDRRGMFVDVPQASPADDAQEPIKPTDPPAADK